MVTCKYSSVGCNAKVMIANITAHERKCFQRPFKCPKLNCAWECPLGRMRTHLQREHGASLLTETRDSVTLLRNFGTTFKWQKTILFSNEIFVHVSRVVEGTLHTFVLHVGDEETTTKFSYTAEIKKRNSSSNNPKATFAVRNYICDLKQIITSANCARFNYHFAQRCAGEERILKVNLSLNHKLRR